MSLQSSALLQSERGIVTTYKHTDLQKQDSLMSMTEHSLWRICAQEQSDIHDEP